MDRRRGSPPRGRGGGHGGPPGYDRRRPRSRSPGDMYRRSPPPYKRYRREDDRYGPGPRGYGGGGGGRFPDDRRRGGYRDYDNGYRERDYRGPPSPREPVKKSGPMSYREFILTLHDDVTPDESQALYQEHLKQCWGSEVRAEFEQRKTEEWMRKQFDPREMQKLINRRNELALKAAKAFAEDFDVGKLDPNSEGFQQGDLDGSPPGPWPPPLPGKGADAVKKGKKKRRAPALCWQLQRVKADLELSRQLLDKLDEQKGISATDNVFSAKAAPVAAAAAETATENPPEAAKDAEAPTQEAPKADAEQPPAEDVAPQAPDAAAAEAAMEDTQAAVDGAPAAEDAPATEAANGDAAAAPAAEATEQVTEAKEADPATETPQLPDEPLALLDLQLTYLWRVHGVDYYGCREYGGPDDPSRVGARRTLRGPKPPEGKQEEASTAGEEAVKLMDQLWTRRLDMEDLMEGPLQKKKVEQLVEEWIESQVTMLDENKWGCKLSTKLFVGKPFVLKHVRVKHAARLQEETDKILDQIYYDNFQRFKEEEEARKQEEDARKQKEEAKLAAAAVAAGGDSAAEDGEMAFDPSVSMPARMMSGMRMMPGMMMSAMDPMMAGALMPGPMAPMLMPAPGAGPMGPFIMPGPMVPPMDLIAPPMPPRGPPPGRGGGRGRGRGRREYVDLDAPYNNRPMLDYGDL